VLFGEVEGGGEMFYLGLFSGVGMAETCMKVARGAASV